MKVIKRMSIIGGILIVIGIIGMCILFATKSFNDGNGVIYKRIKQTSDNTTLTNDVKEIEIYQDYGSVIIEESDNDKVSYEYQGRGLEVENSNNKLIFKEKDSIFLINILPIFFFDETGSNLKIKIPKAKDISLLVNCGFSKVDIKNQDLLNINIDVNVGDLNVKNLKVKDNIDLKNNVGKISLRKVSEANKLLVNCDVGDIELREVYIKKVEAKNNIGVIDFRNDNKAFTFDVLDIDVDLGDSKIDVK